MVIPFLFLMAGAGAADVHVFPARPHQEVRGAVREVLRRRRPWGDADLARARRVGPVAAALIVIEEINASLARSTARAPEPRVREALERLLHLPGVAAIGAEYHALRAELGPLFDRVPRSVNLEPALDVAIHFKVWMPEDLLRIDLARVRRGFLSHWFFLISASARRLAPDQLDEVERRLLASDSDPHLRFGLLTEIQRLPPAHDAMALRLLRQEFLPREVSRESRVIDLHLLGKWQRRVIAREPRALAALAVIERETTGPAARAFARRLRLGVLPTEATEARVRARDPLRLTCDALVVGDTPQ